MSFRGRKEEVHLDIHFENFIEEREFGVRVIEDKSRSSKVAPGEHASSLNFWSEDGFYAHPLALHDASNRVKERRSEKRKRRNDESYAD